MKCINCTAAMVKIKATDVDGKVFIHRWTCPKCGARKAIES